MNSYRCSAVLNMKIGFADFVGHLLIDLLEK
ncbi:hypothetical protein RUMOBE_01318 [Blautia obeum ATCC 29174]|uniref:Uncharacterized protein n=1 Tax=Blautia obeum ATCC 29174 TaxID=411459 RepID=A5ZQP3_9FIRM|nr:hypothetical protein RUMOBE_01318 [Blautia obeum ATCC 29174]